MTLSSLSSSCQSSRAPWPHPFVDFLFECTSLLMIITSGDTRCADIHLDQALHLQCPIDTTIDRILFSSIGNATGTCGRFQKGSCHVTNTLVENTCKGQKECSIAPWMYRPHASGACVAALGSAATWKIQVSCKRLFKSI